MNYNETYTYDKEAILDRFKNETYKLNDRFTWNKGSNYIEIIDNNNISHINKVKYALFKGNSEKRILHYVICDVYSSDTNYKVPVESKIIINEL